MRGAVDKGSISCLQCLPQHSARLAVEQGLGEVVWLVSPDLQR